MTTETVEQKSIKFINTEQTQNQFNSLPLDLFECGELRLGEEEKTLEPEPKTENGSGR